MLLKKNRQTLRGLSYQEKVKKLQKLTRVPLQNLKTNIAQSDLEEDDISVPLCLKHSSNANELTQKQCSSRCESKGKVFDQQQINKTIRMMTKELYTLELGKQKSPIHASKDHQRTVSIFSIQDLQLESLGGQSKAFASKKTLEDFYSTSKNRNSTQNLAPNGLSQISRKWENMQNKNLTHRQKPEGKKQKQQRQTQPILSHQHNQPTKYLFSPKPDTNRKNDEVQSQISKRFSRSKRGSDQLNELKFQKKLKFNRSNQKNRHPNKGIDKENIQNIYTKKKGLLTERLSFETIPTYETLENDFKKRKNIGKNFISFQKQNILRDASYRDNEGQQKARIQIGQKNSLKKLISGFEEISKNQVYKKIQQGNIQGLMQNKMAKDLLIQVFTKYRQSIELLKSLQ